MRFRRRISARRRQKGPPSAARVPRAPLLQPSPFLRRGSPDVGSRRGVRQRNKPFHFSVAHKGFSASRNTLKATPRRARMSINPGRLRPPMQPRRHCHVGQFYLSMARRAYGQHTANSPSRPRGAVNRLPQLISLEPNHCDDRRSGPPRTEFRRKRSMSADEKVIRERAYELWDHAGRPNGRSEEFWFAARAELERTEGSGERQLGAPVHRRAQPPRHELAFDWGKRDPASRLRGRSNPATRPSDVGGHPNRRRLRSGD